MPATTDKKMPATDEMPATAGTPSTTIPLIREPC
jgi:hypothetical protein